MVVVCSHLRYKTCGHIGQKQIQVVDKVYSIRSQFPLMMYLTSNQTAVGYHQDKSTSMVPLGISLYGSHCSDPQVSQLGKINKKCNPICLCVVLVCMFMYRVFLNRVYGTRTAPHKQPQIVQYQALEIFFQVMRQGSP